VDTDQIIPAVYLKRVTKTGFEDALFAAWRGDPDFILNQDAYKHGSVLVAGPDFGTGSSREHAVWALKDYGFKVAATLESKACSLESSRPKTSNCCGSSSKAIQASNSRCPSKTAR
jgi:hypothetical protein